MTAPLVLTADRIVAVVDKPNSFGSYTALGLQGGLDMAGHTITVAHPASGVAWMVQPADGGLPQPVDVALWRTATGTSKQGGVKAVVGAGVFTYGNGKLVIDPQMFPVHGLTVWAGSVKPSAVIVHDLTTVGGAAKGNVNPAECAVVSLSGLPLVVLDHLYLDGSGAAGNCVAVSGCGRVVGGDIYAGDTGHSHPVTLYTVPSSTLVGVETFGQIGQLGADSSQWAASVNYEYCAAAELVGPDLSAIGKWAVRVKASHLTVYGGRIVGDIRREAGGTVTLVGTDWRGAWV